MDLLEAGLNVVPPAVFVLGLGTALLGMRPRLAVPVAYGAVAWSFLVEMVGGILNANHWLLDTSLFFQMAAAPAVRPNWVTGGAMVGFGVVAAAVGVATFRRRDLVGE